MVKIRHYVQIFLLVFCTGCASVRTATPTMPTLPAAPTTTTALTLTTVPPPPTSILPTNTSPLPVDNAVGLIAYCSDQDGDFEIWVMNVDGSNQQKLTDNNAMDISPAWSPDGSPIGWVERYYPACQLIISEAKPDQIINLRRLLGVTAALRAVLHPTYTLSIQVISSDE